MQFQSVISNDSKCNNCALEDINIIKMKLKVQQDEIEIGKKLIASSLTEILNYYHKIPLMIEMINGIINK